MLSCHRRRREQGEAVFTGNAQAHTLLDFPIQHLARQPGKGGKRRHFRSLDLADDFFCQHADGAKGQVLDRRPALPTLCLNDRKRRVSMLAGDNKEVGGGIQLGATTRREIELDLPKPLDVEQHRTRPEVPVEALRQAFVGAPEPSLFVDAKAIPCPAGDRLDEPLAGVFHHIGMAHGGVQHVDAGFGPAPIGHADLYAAGIPNPSLMPERELLQDRFEINYRCHGPCCSP